MTFEPKFKTVNQMPVDKCKRKLYGRWCDVHFFWVEVVQDGAERQAVPPRRAEVGDLHPAVLVGDVLTPLQQRLAGVHQGLSRRRRRRTADEEGGKRGKTSGVGVHFYLSSIVLPVRLFSDRRDRIGGLDVTGFLFC